MYCSKQRLPRSQLYRAGLGFEVMRLPAPIGIAEMLDWRRMLAEGLWQINRLISAGLPDNGTGSALVFAPHADDEVLGCGGTIALKAKAGARINVVVMTDGRASHRRFISEENLIRMRRAEAEEAAIRLGIDAAAYVFLDFEDHRLAQQREAALNRVVELITQFKPDEIYLPNRRDGIIDHVETNRIVRDAVAQINRPALLLEYPVWLWNNWPWTQRDTPRAESGSVKYRLGLARDIAEIVLKSRIRNNVRSVLDQKLAAIGAYRSQVERLNGNLQWPVLGDVAGGEFLQRFRTDIEIFRRTDHKALKERGSGRWKH